MGSGDLSWVLFHLDVTIVTFFSLDQGLLEQGIQISHSCIPSLIKDASEHKPRV